jgi:Putative auto-transporter adhesin, head GIN domain
MLKNALLIVFIIGCISTGLSQSKEKIKGDREVTSKETKLNAFNRIIVGEDFKIDIIEGTQASVFVETDDNLHDIIKFDVTDSTLTFNTSHKITSSKKINIKVMYTRALRQIETFEDGEISSLTSVNLDKVILKNTGSSKAFLNIKTKDFKFINSDRAKVKLNVNSQIANLELAENSNVDALINADTLNVDLYQRADAKIEGTLKHLKVRADNSTNFVGKDLTASTAEVICEINSDVAIQVTKSLAIEASGSSEVYIYADPKITLNKFSDTAKLHKKEMKK